MSPTLDTAELAAELGRSESWVHHHWRWLVTQQRMPAPVAGAEMAPAGEGGALRWSRAQVYAWLDRHLTPPQRAAAAAWRAAAHAYVTGPNDEAVRIAADRAAIETKLGIGAPA